MFNWIELTFMRISPDLTNVVDFLLIRGAGNQAPHEKELSIPYLQYLRKTGWDRERGRKLTCNVWIPMRTWITYSKHYYMKGNLHEINRFPLNGRDVTSSHMSTNSGCLGSGMTLVCQHIYSAKEWDKTDYEDTCWTGPWITVEEEWSAVGRTYPSRSARNPWKTLMVLSSYSSSSFTALSYSSLEVYINRGKRRCWINKLQLFT